MVTLLAALMLGSGAGVAAARRPAEPLRVGAAISLKAALEDLAAAYEKETGRAVKLTFGSSGQVMGQIRNGAPIDLFISAAHGQIDQLARERLIDERSRRIVAGNTLALVVPIDAEDPPASFADLGGSKVRRLALGEPKSVPAGQYAQQVLDHLKLTEKLRDRIVYGTNVRQVLSYVERGEVSAGIVYRTDALESGAKVRQAAVADTAWHEPIEYPAVIVKNTSRRATAEAFLQFLQTPEARRMLEARGFRLPPTPD